MNYLIKFLDARLDEREAGAKEMLADNAHSRASIGLGSTLWDEQDADAQAELREVAALRAIVRRCAARVNEMDVHPNGLVSPRALLARQVLIDAATIWRDHPDYRVLASPWDHHDAWAAFLADRACRRSSGTRTGCSWASSSP